MRRYIDRKKLEQLEKDLKNELENKPRDRAKIKMLRSAIAIQKDLLGE